MLKSLITFLRFLGFWLIFFYLDRLIFLLYFSKKLAEIPLTETLQTFVRGLRLDASMATYASVVPLLGYLILWFIPKAKLSKKIPKTYTRILIVLFSIITVVNFNIYREWGTKINYRALDFAFHAPNEALASSASSPIFLSLIVLAGLIASGFFLEKKIIVYKIAREKSISKKISFSVVSITIAFLIIRGGWQLSPINESMSYFSDNPILNHAAINTQWSLVHNIISNRSNKNPYRYFSPTKAEKIVEELYRQPAGKTRQILITKRPNIVLIIVESYTANVIQSLEGEKGVAPHFENLIKEGVLFSNLYASGDRTDKGLVAILSAFPSQAIRSVIKDNGKQEKLRALAGVLKLAGYNTSFYYGGESEFFNMKSYIMSHGYDHLLDKNFFRKEDMNSKWGAHDGVLFQKHLQDLKSFSEPFFSTVLTLTNHEPFELPAKPRFGNRTDSDKFKSTAYYVDSCLNSYLNFAKKEPWYKNTLFVLVADHGHRLPANKYEIYHPRRFKIPLLFFGDAIKLEYKGKKIETTGSQTDIPATLLAQLNINYGEFKFSRDLLNPQAKAFAFYNWDNGFGFATPEATVSFDNIGKNTTYNKEKKQGAAQANIKSGKALMQEVYSEYLKL